MTLAFMNFQTIWSTISYISLNSQPCQRWGCRGTTSVE